MCVGIGASANNSFQQRLSDYAGFTYYNIGKDMPEATRRKIIEDAGKFDHIVISLHDMNRSASKNYGLTQPTIDFIHELSYTGKAVLVVFGNPYALKYFEALSSIVVAYEDNALFQDICAQMLFGVSAFNGRLPIYCRCRLSC